MRPWFACGSLVAALALGTTVRAETAGGFSYTIPAGWSACKGPAGFDASLCGPKDALIAIKSPSPGPDAAAIARVGLAGAEVIRDQDAVFAGQPGHVIVAKATEGANTLLVAVAATAANGGVKVVLLATPANIKDAVPAWAQVIDGGKLGDAAAPATATRKFQVTNLAPGCEATVVIDGKSLAVPGGKTTEIMLTEGKHEFEWTDPAGGKHSATADVPPAASLGAACTAATPPSPPVTPASSTPATPPTPPAPPAAEGEQAMFDGARAMVSFYRTCWNLVFDHDELDVVPKSMDRLMLKLVAGRPEDRRKDFAKYTQYLHDLEGASAKTKDDADARRKLRRVAFVVLLSAGQIDLPKACEPAAQTQEGITAAIDCGTDAVLKLVKEEPAKILIVMGVRFARIATSDVPEQLMAAVTKLGQGGTP